MKRLLLLLIAPLLFPAAASAGVNEAPPIVICVSKTANEVVRSPQNSGKCLSGATEDFAVWKRSTAEALEHITFLAEGPNHEPTIEVTNVNVIIKGGTGLGNVSIGTEDEPTGSDSLLVGAHNSSSGFGDAVFGESSKATASSAFVFGGNTNKATKPEAVVLGGYANTAAAEESVICGGEHRETTTLLQNLC